jgi:hypothetical protein
MNPPFSFLLSNLFGYISNNSCSDPTHITVQKTAGIRAKDAARRVTSPNFPQKGTLNAAEIDQEARQTPEPELMARAAASGRLANAPKSNQKFLFCPEGKQSRKTQENRKINCFTACNIPIPAVPEVIYRDTLRSRACDERLDLIACWRWNSAAPGAGRLHASSDREQRAHSCIERPEHSY